MRTWTILALLIAAALAGCADAGDDSEPTDSTAEDDPATGAGGGAEDPDTGDDEPAGPDTPADNDTVAPAAATANLTADVVAGEAPLTVTFTLDGTPADTAWSLALGDGTTTEGESLTATFEHTFAAGNHTAVLTVLSEGGDATASLGISAEAPRVLPETNTWTFGPTGVCVHDLLTLADGPHTPCAGHVLGPEEGADVPEGRWIQMGPAYEGLLVYSTMDHGAGHGHDGGLTHPLYDSDCWFLDDAHEIIGEAHNGGAGCAGEVPAGAAWLYIASYMVPATEVYVEVQLP